MNSRWQAPVSQPEGRSGRGSSLLGELAAKSGQGTAWSLRKQRLSEVPSAQLTASRISIVMGRVLYMGR